MTQFDYQRVKAEVHDYCLAEGTTIMEHVKFLVSGWNVLPDGSYHKFKDLCDFEQAQTYLRLATMRNSNKVVIKVDNIEVVWNTN